MEPRRFFLSRLAGLPFLAMAATDRVQSQAQAQTRKPLKIMMKSAWGSDDPTKAAFPFSHGLALAEAGHEGQIFLLGEAVVLMRKVVAEAVRDTGQSRGQAHSDLCLRRLLPCSWRNRGRSQQLRSEVRKSHNLCFSRGMGRQSDYGIVARSSARRSAQALRPRMNAGAPTYPGRADVWRAGPTCFGVGAVTSSSYSPIF